MPCKIQNPANYDLDAFDGHIDGMYDHFNSKYRFSKAPTMVFDSDPSNQSNTLGKTAYYDPQSLEIHVFIDGRHPKDVLRSIAHELIHHRQNLEDRLETDGYSGPGYYLENDELKLVEHEAMLEGNATMREYEDTVKKHTENKNMSLKEWKNNELNQLLMKKFGILKEVKEDDNVDGDNGDLENLEEGEVPDGLKKYQEGEGKECAKCDSESCDCEKTEESSKVPDALQEAIRRIAKAKKVFLNKRRIK
jgi:hypothetical protein